MKPSHFNRHLKLIVLLLLPVARTQSIGNTRKRFDDGSDSRAVVGSQNGSPYWEFILREFVFRTISPPPPANNKLYKRLLEAPFYGGPFPASTTNDDGLTAPQHLLSRGDVYHLANGGWIICQEGCVECDICKDHKAITTPTVKWTLSRIRRLVPFARPRYDLQLTVMPQVDGSFHMKNLSPVSYVYVTPNTGVLDRFKDTPINRRNEYQPRYPFGTMKPPPKITRDIFTSSETPTAFDEKKKPTIGNEELIDRSNSTTSSSVPSTQTTIATNKILSSRKRGREIFRGGQNHQGRMDGNGQDENIVEHSEPTEKSIPSVLFRSSTMAMAETTDAGCRPGRNSRLILGTDQFGEKHLIHVVGAGHLDTESTTPSVDPGGELDRGKSNLSKFFNVVQKQEDHPLYRKILKRVMDSLNEHKSAIEKFLFSPARSGRPLIGPATSGDAENASLTTTNYSWSSNVDLEDGTKSDGIPANGVGDAVPQSSNQSTPQLQESSTVEGRRTEPKPTTTRRLELQRKPQLPDPSMANHFERKMSSGAPAETSIEPRSTVGSGADAAKANAVQISQVLGEVLDEKSDGRRSVAGKPKIDEDQTRRMDSEENSDSLILKEVARSVVDHADTLRGFVAADNSTANF